MSPKCRGGGTWSESERGLEYVKQGDLAKGEKMNGIHEKMAIDVAFIFLKFLVIKERKQTK